MLCFYGFQFLLPFFYKSIAFEKVKKQLQILGGNLRHLGDMASASPAMDLATLSWLYGSYVGLIYGVKLCQSFGLKLGDYSEIINGIVPGFKDFFIHEINTIEQGNYNITQSPLAISVTATRRIAQTFGKIGVDTEFPNIIANILKRAETKGFAREELAAIIKVINKDGK